MRRCTASAGDCGLAAGLRGDGEEALGSAHGPGSCTGRTTAASPGRKRTEEGAEEDGGGGGNRWGDAWRGGGWKLPDAGPKPPLRWGGGATGVLKPGALAGLRGTAAGGAHSKEPPGRATEVSDEARPKPGCCQDMGGCQEAGPAGGRCNAAIGNAAVEAARCPATSRGGNGVGPGGAGGADGVNAPLPAPQAHRAGAGDAAGWAGTATVEPPGVRRATCDGGACGCTSKR